MSRRELTGWVFDVVPDTHGMTVWFRTEAGETVALSAPFRPSFILAGKTLKETNVRTASARWNCSLSRGEGTEFFSGKTIPAWTFTVAAPALLGPTVRKAEKAFGPEALFNADIAPEQQYAYATGLYPLSRACVECDGEGTIVSSRILDSPWDVDASRPFLSTALLRMEGTGHPAHRRVRPLEFVSDGITHSLQWDDGTEFLRSLLRLLQEADPDLLITEYGDDWLLPRLLALASQLRVPLPLGRPRRTAAGDSIRRTRERSYLSYGRVVFLATPHTLSGRWHVDARNSFLFGETGLQGLIELARLSGTPLQRVARTSPGTATSAMQVATALRRGILVPYKKREPEEFKSGVELVVADKGGLTYIPRPGMHENVGELDFASMYPSLMDRYNISPETINCACCRPGLPVPEIGTHTCLRTPGARPRHHRPDSRQAPAPEGAAEGSAGPGSSGSFQEAADSPQVALRRLLRIPRVSKRPVRPDRGARGHNGVGAGETIILLRRSPSGMGFSSPTG